MGVVPQDTVLFNETIGYNIAYGNLDAGPGEVTEVARKAQLDGSIASMPQVRGEREDERGWNERSSFATRFVFFFFLVFFGCSLFVVCVAFASAACLRLWCRWRPLSLLLSLLLLSLLSSS